jgi:hypothetical protein
MQAAEVAALLLRTATDDVLVEAWATPEAEAEPVEQLLAEVSMLADLDCLDMVWGSNPGGVLQPNVHCFPFLVPDGSSRMSRQAGISKVDPAPLPNTYRQGCGLGFSPVLGNTTNMHFYGGQKICGTRV